LNSYLQNFADPLLHSTCRLTALKSLDISNSSFSGPLPTSFNSSTSLALTSLTAFGNKLTGALPASVPANLTTLGLGYNQFNGTLPAYNSSSLSYIQVSERCCPLCGSSKTCWSCAASWQMP